MEGKYTGRESEAIVMSLEWQIDVELGRLPGEYGEKASRRSSSYGFGVFPSGSEQCSIRD